MKILYVLPHPIQYQTPLIKYLTKKGLDITVGYKSNHSSQKFYDKGFRKKINWSKSITQGYNYFYNNKHAILKKILTDKEINYVWIHGSKSFYNLIIIIISKLLNKKILLREENFMNSKKRSFFNIISNKFFYFFLDFFIFKYLSIGIKNKKYYLKNNVNLNKIINVPYCVDNDFFFQKKTKNKKTNFINFLFAGKLNKTKGLDILIKAFRDIYSKKNLNANYKLTIVGNGDCYQNLKKVVKKNKLFFIKILNFQTQIQLKNIYQSSDILILPSRFEPWGLVINEAMSAGNAIICSDNVGSANDLVKNKINGFIFKNGNTKDLVKAILKYIQKPNLVIKHKQNGIKIINKFSFAVCYKNLSKIIKQ